MSVSILTGYTGERHITPYMDATFNRGILGDEDCILATGSMLEASMPTINSFVIADGAFSIQGHIGITSGETLAVDTCATGYNRIDLVVARFSHNATTLIDAMGIVLIKGTETDSSNPTTPTYNTGTIADGATTVDMVLYKITLSGPDVTFARVPQIKTPLLKAYSPGVSNLAYITNDGSLSDTGYEVRRTDTDVAAFFGIGSGGVNHGIWSRPLGKWLIYGDNAGVARIPATDIRLAGHSSSVGSIVDTYLSSDKSCASGTWYALCNITLPAGTWLIEAGVRWDTNANGKRVANLSTTSANSSQDVAFAPVSGGVTQTRFARVVNITASTKYYLNAYQNSGSAVKALASGTAYGNFIRAVRLV